DRGERSTARSFRPQHCKNAQRSGGPVGLPSWPGPVQVYINGRSADEAPDSYIILNGVTVPLSLRDSDYVRAHRIRFPGELVFPRSWLKEKRLEVLNVIADGRLRFRACAVHPVH